MSSSSTEDSSGAAGSQELTPSMLNIIRFALLGGSVLFGAVAWYLTSSGQMTPSMDEGVTSIFGYVFYSLLVISMLGIWLVRQHADRAETFTQRGRLLIVGYALAEGLALFGGVYLLLTGNTALFLGGLLVFVIAFVLLPLQPRSDG